MKRYRNISAILLCLFLPGMLLGGSLSYRSDRLERMGKLLGEEKLAALPDGEHTSALMFMDTPITLIKDKGIVEHIGYSFFSAEERRLTGPVVCNFLERYALEADLPFKKEKTLDTQLLEDGVVFCQGSLSTLKALCPGGHGVLEIHNISHSRYIFKWQGGQMLFPSDVDLLTGRDMRENGRRLPQESNQRHSPNRYKNQTVLKSAMTAYRSTGMGITTFPPYLLTLFSQVRTWNR